MEIKIESKDDISICRVSGEITFSTSPDLRKRLIELTDKHIKKIVIDMKNLTYIDSSGMATVVEILQKIKAIDGELKLANVPDKIKDILEMVRLKDIFDIQESEEAALASF
ncbi:MAG: STAS domain-containing protein [Candidatus Omnitrophica bacterium]|nr:STAS domain-containing protein [Candidatus Omnitrophota bacterium]